MTTPRHWLGQCYRLFERVLLARLPAKAQRATALVLFAVCKRLLPSTRWPGLKERLLLRRQIFAPPKQHRSLPPQALDDMLDLALHVDQALAPDRFLSNAPAVLLAPVHWTQAGHAYRRILSQLADREYETIILVPWLKRGGADLGALHHARACVEIFGQRTLVIATEPGESPWAERLPGKAEFLSIGAELANLSNAMCEPEMVLARLLIQLAPVRVHLINSHVGWRTIERYGLAIRQGSRLFASLYCDERDRNGVRSGLAQNHLPASWQWLDAVISDNSVSPREWTETMGIKPELFHTVHFPCPVDSPAPPRGHAPACHRLLWASRFEAQKRPDLLVELAKLLPEFQWDVYGEPLAKDDEYHRALQRLNNVTLHGKYETFLEIVRPDHLAYVYTTAWDGLPNVLLEAAAADLPIVAPDIGGIRDLLPRELLLPAGAQAADYALAIRALTTTSRRDSHLLKQRPMLEMFTWEQFAKHMARIGGYTGT